jgi:hypothetical protein
VHDDGVRDELFGGDGHDWFLLDLGDRPLAAKDVADRRRDELTEDLAS